MKATAHRSERATYVHHVDIRNHELVVDEPKESGGSDEGPSPQELLAASLATCSAITMEMYAKRKGWDIGPIGVSVEYTPSERGCPTKFSLDVTLPSDCTEEQRERLQVIAAKCPVHRTLEGEVMFEDRITIADAGDAPAREQQRSRRDMLRRRALSRT
jgi:putative redox protein